MTDLSDGLTNYENVPPELKALRQWVCYRIEERDGTPTKIPYRTDKVGRGNAKSNDPSTWHTFDEVVEALGKPQNRFNGIGFILSESDPYVFIDLDHVVDAGVIEPWALQMIEHVDSYTEYSQSGTGIHIIARAKKPGPRCRTHSKPEFEIYDNMRLVVFTGKLWDQSLSVIRDAQQAVKDIYFGVFGDTAHNVPPKETVKNARPVGMSDPVLIERALAASNGPKFERLWNGNTGEYNGDASAADLALCCMLAYRTDKDPIRMDRLFRESGLMRPKWDERRGPQTYGQITIDAAIVRTHATYSDHVGKGRNKRKAAHCLQTPDSQGHVPGAAPDGFPLTDLGNAERLICAHGKNLRFDVSSGKWLLWTGTHWRPDETGEIHRLARTTVRNMYDLLKQCSNDSEIEALFAFIKRSESAPRLDAMEDLARYCRGIPLQSADLDYDPMLFNCQNGTLDLRTGELREHRPTDLLSKISPVSYDPAAQCPRWLQFLVEVFQQDEELITFAQRMAGYALTGETREQCFFILQGKGSNGKGVFINTICRVLGDYVKDTPVTTFVDRRGEQTNDLASLAGTRMVTASEAEQHTSFNEGLVKKLTGQDPVTCRFLRQEFFTYQPTFKLFIATNEVPRIRSQNYAMKRRVKLLPFRVRFYYPHEKLYPVRDETLADSLEAESSGILTWMAAGCLQWQKQGLGMPDTMLREVDSLFESMDPLVDFIETECELHPRHTIEVGELWKAYQQWCDDNKQKPAFKRVNEFSRSLCARDNIEAKRTKSARYLAGIALADDQQNGNTAVKRVSSGDEKTNFSINSHAHTQLETQCEKVNSRHPTSPSGSDQPNQPSRPCRECGSSDWLQQTAARGGWICRTCNHAIGMRTVQLADGSTVGVPADDNLDWSGGIGI